METCPKTIDFANAVIEDFRENDDPVDFIFQNEHSTNDLPSGMSWSQHDQEHFKDTHWAYDIGSLNLARALAKEFKTILVYSKYSRLYVDVNRSMVSIDLNRKSGDGRVIELNENITQEEQLIRIQLYSTYFQALRVAFKMSSPQKVYSIHSFTSKYEGVIRTLDIGVLSSEQDDFSKNHIQPFIERGYICVANKPWAGNKFGNFSLDCSKFQSVSRHLEGVLLEIRNDFLSNDKKFQDICRDIISVIKEINQQ